MYFQKECFLLKMNPRYFQISLGYKMGPSKEERSKGGRLKFLVDLEK